jgi:hypothetical protein
MREATGRPHLTWSTKHQKLIGLVNAKPVRIHHAAKAARIWRTAFIFGEAGARMVNRRCAAIVFNPVPRVNPVLNRIGLQLVRSDMGE